MMVKSLPDFCMCCRVLQLSNDPSTSTWSPPWLPTTRLSGSVSKDVSTSPCLSTLPGKSKRVGVLTDNDCGDELGLRRPACHAMELSGVVPD